MTTSPQQSNPSEALVERLAAEICEVIQKNKGPLAYTRIAYADIMAKGLSPFIHTLLAAERERCAVIVETPPGPAPWKKSAGNVTAKIRALPPGPDALEMVRAEAVKQYQVAAKAIDEVVRSVEARCMAADGPVTPTLQEMTEHELRVIWIAADSIRALLQPENQYHSCGNVEGSVGCASSIHDGQPKKEGE